MCQIYHIIFSKKIVFFHFSPKNRKRATITAALSLSKTYPKSHRFHQTTYIIRHTSAYTQKSIRSISTSTIPLIFQYVSYHFLRISESPRKPLELRPLPGAECFIHRINRILTLNQFLFLLFPHNTLSILFV